MANRRAWAAFAATAAAMVATPLARRGGRTRMVLADVVVAGLAATAGSVAARRWGAGRAITAAGAVAASTLAVEQVGSRTGVPFGRYAYTDQLQPQVAGVPAVVPVAWFAMGLPARDTAATLLGAGRPPALRWALGSALLTAWDLFLDPQMTAEGYWRWARPGRYRGIPAVNYLGWFLTGLAVMAVLDRALPPPAADRPGDPALVGLYGWMAAMSTVGFAAFFGDRPVAVAGGAAMLPPAVAAAWKVARG